MRVPGEGTKERILGALPPDGSWTTNKQIREELGVSDEDYWRAQRELYQDKKIEIGQGQGGRIALTVKPQPRSGRSKDTIVKEEISRVNKEILEENMLYEPFSKCIEKSARDEGAENTIIQITARQGRRQTGGEWSRPDVCQISLKRLRYLGQKTVEVTTYEIKTSDCDVSAVYEALSHSRRAHRSYLAIHIDPARVTTDQRLQRIEMECARAGVGLILFGNPADFSTFKTIVDPKANWVDLAEVNDFISNQIDGRDKILDWF